MSDGTPMEKVETKAKSAEKAQGKGMPKALRNTILSATAIVAGVEGIGATATELTDNKPFLDNPTHTIQIGTLQKAGYNMLHPFGWIKNLQKNNEASSTFDNSKVKQIIGPNNMKRITSEEAEKQDLLTPKITVDQAAKTITISTLFTTSPANEPILSTTLDKTYHAPGQISLSPDDPRNSFGEEHREVPANFPIILPKGMHYALITGEPGWNSPNPSRIIGFFYDPQTNVTFRINYHNEKLLPFSPDPKSIDWETYKKSFPFNGENLPVSDGINPITATAQQQSLDITVDAVIGNDISSYAAVTTAFQTRLKVILTHPTTKDDKLYGLSP